LAIPVDAATEFLARQGERRIEMKVELRSPGHDDRGGVDARIDSQQLPLHGAVPDEIVIVGDEDATSRSQVVPGEDETGRPDTHRVRNPKRQLAGQSVDVRTVEDQIGAQLREQRGELRYSASP
jgi:hypothetical protein